MANSSNLHTAPNGQHHQPSKKSEAIDITTLWLTGLSGSGKTTIANHLIKHISPSLLIDGDTARSYISPDLGFTKEERDLHINRMIGVCRLASDNNITTIASLISPTKKIRDHARHLLPDFIEIYVDCPLDTCKARDVKGHYAKASKDPTMPLVGITVPYEAPTNPEIHLHTEVETIQDSIQKILSHLDKKHIYKTTNTISRS